jgi:hypothetical protein
LLAVTSAFRQIPASKLACSKAAASCRTPKHMVIITQASYWLARHGVVSTIDDDDFSTLLR